LAGGLSGTIDVKNLPQISRSIGEPAWLLLEVWLSPKQIGQRNSARRTSTGSQVRAVKKRESVERAGKRSRPKSAMKAAAKGCTRS
jgi:hypothetical protein